MNSDLVTLIGQAIHHCGALELRVNNGILALAKDNLLAEHIVTYPFSKRIILLRKLLIDRSKMKPDDITWLCKELSQISEMRNQVAHNPIASDDPHIGAAYILIVGNAPDKVEKMSCENVKAFVRRTGMVVRRMPELFPPCRNRDRR